MPNGISSMQDAFFFSNKKNLALHSIKTHLREKFVQNKWTKYLNPIRYVIDGLGIGKIILQKLKGKKKERAKCAIYTAIYGDYDKLKEHVKQNIDVDFICFTDKKALTSTQQTIIHVNKSDIKHPRMQAKYFKILNHRIFKPIHKKSLFNKKFNYDYTIWIDGSVQITSPFFAENIIAHTHKQGLAMFIHPDRDCIYTEVHASSPMLKYQGLSMQEQVNSYKNEGYPESNGLMAATIIGRKTNQKILAKINEEWWAENVKWTYQDQLSLPYVLWKNNYTYTEIHVNLWNNDWFQLHGHSHLY